MVILCGYKTVMIFVTVSADFALSESATFLPDPKNRSISVSGKGSGIVSMVINELKSSWPEK
ncbi:hypothetical protein OAU80_00890 [Opitutales bacterium]|nr:hypothetical protein [Opitutales bacterium]